MTEQHRAKLEVWAAVEKLGKNDMDMLNCVLELRSRVEALERDRQAILDSGSRLRVGLDAVKPAESNYLEKPDSLLVDLVSDALMESVKDQHSMARAAIRQIAAWLQRESYLHLGSGSYWAKQLQKEAR